MRPDTPPAALLELLHHAAGESLRYVVCYDADAYEYLYVRGDVAADHREDTDARIREFRRDATAKPRRESAFGASELTCTVHHFEDSVEVNLLRRGDRGVVASVDPGTALEQRRVVSRCQELCSGTDDASE